MAYPPPNDNPSDEAKQRGVESADVIFAETGLDADLDDPEMAAAYDAVASWFARHDDQIVASAAGADDGCPCESCRAHFEGRTESGRES